MRTYRLCFFDEDIVRGRFDFQAYDDDQAVEIAEILFDACSDRCQSWGIWDGYMLLMAGPGIFRTWPRASELAERRQENIIECEEVILSSGWAVASSERLVAELDKLRASLALKQVNAAPLEQVRGSFDVNAPLLPTVGAKP